jgi:hypothetical protein
MRPMFRVVVNAFVVISERCLAPPSATSERTLEGSIETALVEEI